MEYSSDGPNGGGTANVNWPDVYAAAMEVCASGWIDPHSDWDLDQMWAEQHADLMQLRGAVVDGIRICWWPVPRSDRRGPQVERQRRLGLWSGHKCRRRGRHWDRTRH